MRQEDISPSNFNWIYAKFSAVAQGIEFQMWAEMVPFLLPQFLLSDLLTAAGELLRFPRSSWGTFTYDVRTWERGGWLKADDPNDSLRDNDQSPIAQNIVCHLGGGGSFVIPKICGRHT